MITCLLTQNYRRQHRRGSSPQESSLPPQDTFWTRGCPGEELVVPKHVPPGPFILSPTYSVITELKIHEVGNESIYSGRHSQASRSKPCAHGGTTPKLMLKSLCPSPDSFQGGLPQFLCYHRDSCSCERDGESFKVSYSLSSCSSWQLAYPNIPDNLDLLLSQRQLRMLSASQLPLSWGMTGGWQRPRARFCVLSKFSITVAVL